MVEIKLGSAEQIAFRVPGWLASKLQAMAGSYWQVDRNYPQGLLGPESGSGGTKTSRFVVR
jgi:hypothetical protein